MELTSYETSVEDLVLMAYPLTSKEDIRHYKEFLQLFPNNPFYKMELLTFGKRSYDELMYFVMMYDGRPLVLMPFWLKKVILDGKETGYYDISSTYGYSGPIFTKSIDRKLASQFWIKVDSWYKKNNVVSEFIRFNMQENWMSYTGNIKPTLINVRGKVLPTDEQWKNFKPKVRNNYRKSLKSGLRSNIYHNNINIEVIKQFYDIYTHTMVRNNASQHYFYNLDYLINLISNNPSTCAIIIVYKDDIPISAELLLLSDNTINSFLGGTNYNYFDTRPNDFLKIEVLQWARKNNFTYYFLGGGKVDNDSLYHYKKDFFPLDENPIFYTGRKIVDLEIYNTLVSSNLYCIDCNYSNYFPLYRCKQAC